MRYLFAVLSLVALYAQSARVGGNGERFLVLVPMVGAGTFQDPKRPAFLREAGVAFRYQLSDDGATAIAEVSPRGPLEMVRLEERMKGDSRVKVFKPHKDKAVDVVAEVKKVKKDFDLDSFAKHGAGTAAP